MYTLPSFVSARYNECMASIRHTIICLIQGWCGWKGPLQKMLCQLLVCVCVHTHLTCGVFTVSTAMSIGVHFKDGCMPMLWTMSMDQFLPFGHQSPSQGLCSHEQHRTAEIC